MTMRPLHPLLLAAIFALIFSIAAHSVARAQETWVAVADDGGSNFGYAVGMATREAAEVTALGECGGGCALKLTSPARCVAYARSDTGNASGYSAGPTLDAVRDQAWQQCNRRVPANSCTVRAARCFE
jgi:uncharacterized protein DUF4189